MQNASLRKLIGVLGINLCLAIGATSALADVRPMPIGRSAPAPVGFLDFCNRSPEQCRRPGENTADVQSQARSLFWAAVFNRPEATSSPAQSRSPSSTSAPTLRTATERSHISPTNWTRLQSGHPAIRRPDPNVLDANTVSPLSHGAYSVAMSSRDWERAEQINRHFNRHIRKASDQRLYGIGDHWAVPEGSSPRGDCEDYVLAKRAALIEAGFPASVLSIALVVTAWGESHAVLLLSTSEGEFVLDNLTSRMARWDAVDFTWIKRQLPGNILEWVELH